ncbi:MAG TPA: hypothetical protein VFI47_05875 [Acidimicrobiales bacterium]|nr:hypothetical protein [Acidimicrobiales bacterium]
MHAKTRGRQKLVADLTPARRAWARATLVGALVTGLVASACSTGSTAADGDHQPTFARATGTSLVYDEPVATAADLLPPAGEGEPWTIVGSLFDPDTGATAGAVWTAPDGRRWERSTIRPADRHVSESLAAAVATGDGVLAVGQIGDGAESDAAIWHRNGDGWERSTPDSLGGDHEQWAFDVASGPGGTVIAGGENVWGEVRARIWFSKAGTDDWTAVDGGPGGVFDASGEESVRDVVAVGSGFVAVGSRAVDAERDGVAWYSADGTTWEALDTPALGGPGRQELTSVVDTGAGVVAGGYADVGTGQAQPVTWRSPDGRSWEPSAGALPLNGDDRNGVSDLAVRSLSVDDQGILASGGSKWRPHVWRSSDGGATWATLPNPIHGGLFEDGLRLADAVQAGGVTVGLAADPAVLVLTSRWEDVTGDTFPAGGPQPLPTAVADGRKGTIAGGSVRTPASGSTREQYAGQMWRRDDDGRWTTLDNAQLAGGRVMDVVPIADGYVAVGIEDFGLASGRGVIGDELPDGLAWVSSDGKSWNRVGAVPPRIDDSLLINIENPTPEMALPIAEMEAEIPWPTADPAGGKGTRALTAAAALSSGFVAVGNAYDLGDAEPVAVISTDNQTLTGENTNLGGAGVQRLNDVCVGPDDDVVVVGVTGSTGGFDAIASHRAPDGAWTVATTTDESFTGSGSQIAYGCAASDDGFVIVGSDDRSGDTDARVWTSRDGIEWTRLDAGPLGGGGDQWAGAVAAAPRGGWIAGGTDTAGGDGDVALWRISAKGEVVRRDTGEPALGGPGEQSITNVTVDADGRVILTGTDYGRAGLWESDVLDR